MASSFTSGTSDNRGTAQPVQRPKDPVVQPGGDPGRKPDDDDRSEASNDDEDLGIAPGGPSDPSGPDGQRPHRGNTERGT
jgi:hypothetical protein